MVLWSAHPAPSRKEQPMTELSYEREGTKFVATVEQLPAASIAYLLQYGWAQSLQDTIAGLAKAKAQELHETDDYKSGKLTDGNVADEVSLAILAQLEKRQAAILAGTIGVRVGTVRDPLAGLAREQVKTALAKKGIKVEKEKLAELVASHIAKNGEALRAELARRAADAVEVELDV